MPFGHGLKYRTGKGQTVNRGRLHGRSPFRSLHVFRQEIGDLGIPPHRPYSAIACRPYAPQRDYLGHFGTIRLRRPAQRAAESGFFEASCSAGLCQAPRPPGTVPL
jgi:hypothetical protein